MKNLKWDESLSVDVDEIDDDHRKLVDLFNLLSDAVANSDPTDYIEAILEELITCTVWHFKHEERLMLKYEYKDRIAHTEEHDDLISKVRELQEHYLNSDTHLTSENMEYLNTWLTEHILGHDMKLGFYLLRAM